MKVLKKAESIIPLSSERLRGAGRPKINKEQIDAVKINFSTVAIR